VSHTVDLVLLLLRLDPVRYDEFLLTPDCYVCEFVGLDQGKNNVFFLAFELAVVNDREEETA
jgi:hypothetical protein